MSIQLPDGISPSTLKGYWDLAVREYKVPLRRMELLAGADRNKLWDALNVNFPPYQILPYTNHVSYIKNNLVAGLYSVGRQGQFSPTSNEDKEMMMHLNIALDKAWEMGDIPYHQMKAGNNAALYNIGITHVGWDNTKKGKLGDQLVKGEPVLTTKSPLRWMRDPHAAEWDKGRFVIDWDYYHKDVIASDDDYKEGWEAMKNSNLESAIQSVNPNQHKDITNQKPVDKDYYRVIMFWIPLNGKMYEIHTIEGEHPLLVKELKPAVYPFAVLYCNLPDEDVVGVSEPAKIFANSVAYNLNHSIVLTADAKNQRPPKFVNAQSQINLSSFAKHGNDADYTYIVQGDASKAVHYHQFPVPSQMSSVVGANLAGDISKITGVTDKYTGADTGSITTTGGMDTLVQQATTIDGPKIVNYNMYSKKLTQLVLGLMREFSQKRTYVHKDPKTQEYKSFEIDFPSIPKDALFQLSLDISAYLPRNKQRVAQMANVLMEKQMQYAQGNQQVDLITPEEWLMLQQDLPLKEYMLERMGVQRQQDYIDMVSQVIFQYAELTNQGMDPTDAILATAQTTQDKKAPVQELPHNPVLG